MCNLQLTVTAYDNSDVHSSPGDEILSPWGVHPVLKTVNINFINNKHAYFSFNLSRWKQSISGYSTVILPVLNSATESSQRTATTLVTQLMFMSGIYTCNTQKNHWLPCGTGAHMYAYA